MSKTVAVIGASADRTKFSNKAVRAFARQGYSVIPIHPREAEVEGYKAYRSVLDVPGTIDMATIYLPPALGVKVVEEIAKKGIPDVWINPGADGPEVVARARELGLKPTVACSIIGVGERPSDF
jgi:predicted CoA-binding protein